MNALKSPLDLILKKSNGSPSNWLHLLQSENVEKYTFLQQLDHFFSKRPLLLKDPAIATAAKHLIEMYSEKALKAIRPLSVLWKELSAGQELLKRIDPEPLFTPFSVTTEDGEEFNLGFADMAVLSEASLFFQTMFYGKNFAEGLERHVNLPISSEDFQIFYDSLIKDREPSMESLKCLLVAADIYMIPQLASASLGWFKNYIAKISTSEEKLIAMQQICLLQNELHDKLAQYSKEWAVVRDEAVSFLLSKINDKESGLFDQLVAQIIESQGETVYWPTSLNLICSCQPAIAPLKALEHLALSSLSKKWELRTAEQIANLTQLKSLTLDVNVPFTGFNWS
ncbi:MAG: BTB/POZ domain-containing protein, partial [Parachlamydia sp.]|nr:BTB/POZ domain-containing protein [Parachlamydia sp.]